MGQNTLQHKEGLHEKEQALYQYVRDFIEKEFSNTNWYKKEIYKNGLKINIGKPKEKGAGYYVVYHNHNGCKIVITVDNMNTKRNETNFISAYKKGEPKIEINDIFIDAIIADLGGEKNSTIKNDIIEALS